MEQEPLNRHWLNVSLKDRADGAQQSQPVRGRTEGFPSGSNGRKPIEGFFWKHPATSERRLKPLSVSASILEISTQDRTWDFQSLDLWLEQHKNGRPFPPLLGQQLVLGAVCRIFYSRSQSSGIYPCPRTLPCAPQQEESGLGQFVLTQENKSQNYPCNIVIINMHMIIF